jgi:tetratricopeptide (TPR) repeat protein
MSLVRAAFSSRPTRSGGTAVAEGGAAIVEIPYCPYGYDAPLAVLVDEPGEEASLLSAYERLASEITRGEISRLAPVPDVVRARYRRGLGLEPGDRAETVTLVYAPDDRPWADWIQDQFERVGVQVAKLPPGGAAPTSVSPGAVVAVVSSRLASSPAGAWLARIVRPASADAPAADVVGVRVDDSAADEITGAVHVLDVSRFPEPRARGELLSHFGFVHSTAQPPFPPRFPGTEAPTPRWSNLPPRNPEFVGRHEELERVRDGLVAGRRWTLHGAAGTGKSEIAREYAHRFGHNYDIVWWVPAGHRRGLRKYLTALAGALAVDVAGDAATAVVSVLSQSAERWLLVYDNADDPGVLDGLVPVGGLGHVLVTSRSAGWPTGWPVGQTAAFSGEDATALLYRRVPGMTAVDADRVAAAAEHLPITLHLVAAWLREACSLLQEQGTTVAESAAWASGELVARHQREAARWEQARTPGMPPVSAAAGLAVSLGTLGESPHGRLAARLAELCAFLSPDGVALPILCSPAMLSQLALAGGADGELVDQDGAELHRVLRSGARHGLFDVDWGRGVSVRMHRILQELVRASMDPADARVRREQVLHALSGYAPTDAEVDTLARSANYDDLARHLEPSGALDSDERGVRRWVVQQIRFAYREGDAEAWRSTVAVGQRLLDRWTGAFGTGDDLRLRLAVQVANLERALGRNAEALELDELVLHEQRRTLGLTHPRTLMTGRGRGGDLRGLGRFREALAEDQVTLAGFRDAYGEDHPDTLMAANNLAESSFLVGDLLAALRIGEDTKERRLRLFGVDDPLVWDCAGTVGVCLRELGRFDEARKVLREALTRTLALRVPNHGDELRIRSDLAITNRCAGWPEVALPEAMNVLRSYRATFGDDHPGTKACMLSLAADHHAVGQTTDALDLADRCLHGYLHALGADHPFTHLCRVDLAVFQRSAGEVAKALELSQVALDGLRDLLGETHPWALAAALDHAGHVAAGGDLRPALDLEESTHRDCADYLGPDHPYTKHAAGNLALTRRLVGGGPAGDETGRVDIHLEVPRT